MRNTSLIRIALIAAFLTFIQSCSKAPDPPNEAAGKNSIKGVWYLNKWTLFKRLDFYSDSTAVVDNHIDTIYRVKYAVKGDSLILKSHDSIVSTSTILYLSTDSLVLLHLFNSDSVLSYSRVSRR